MKHLEIKLLLPMFLVCFSAFMPMFLVLIYLIPDEFRGFDGWFASRGVEVFFFAVYGDSIEEAIGFVFAYRIARQVELEDFNRWHIWWIILAAVDVDINDENRMCRLCPGRIAHITFVSFKSDKSHWNISRPFFVLQSDMVRTLYDFLHFEWIIIDDDSVAMHICNPDLFLFRKRNDLSAIDIGYEVFVFFHQRG